MKYIDIHSHVNFSVFDTDRDEVMSRAQEEEVAMINVGTQYTTSARAVEIAQKYEQAYAVVGIHPIHTSVSRYDENELGPGGSRFTSKGEVFDAAAYDELIREPKVVGIGETGLDYHHGDTNDREAMQRQKDAFEAQVVFAAEHNLPVMIHCRDAYDDVLAILRDHKRTYGDALRGNIHFFAGEIDHARQFLELGFSISFTGVVTITSEYDELVRYVPADMIHAETDAPFVSPVPHRGKRNEPVRVQYVVQRLAEVRGEDPEAFGRVLLDNARKVFGLAAPSEV